MAWSEVLAPVLRLYRADEGGQSLTDNVRGDWDLVSESATQSIFPFLEEVCYTLGTVPMPDKGTRLELGRPSAKDMWSLFQYEIGQGRRWFFQELDADRFNRLLDMCVTMRSEQSIDREHIFHRARTLEAERKKVSLKDLGAPPPDRATGGRANPPGIPMLYAATSEKIAVHEVRPSRLASVYTAKFRPRARIALADFTPTSDHKPNPFATDERGDLYEVADVYIAVTLGAIVGEALSQPLRESDNRTEYLPTQYVAEFVRDSGRHGIRFRSSFCSDAAGLDGDNVVLFDPAVVEGVPRSLRRHLITQVGVTYERR